MEKSPSLPLMSKTWAKMDIASMTGTPEALSSNQMTVIRFLRRYPIATRRLIPRFLPAWSICPFFLSFESGHSWRDRIRGSNPDIPDSEPAVFSCDGRISGAGRFMNSIYNSSGQGRFIALRCHDSVNVSGRHSSPYWILLYRRICKPECSCSLVNLIRYLLLRRRHPIRLYKSERSWRSAHNRDGSAHRDCVCLFIYPHSG